MSTPTQPINFEKARIVAQTVLDFDRAYPGDREPVKTLLASAFLAKHDECERLKANLEATRIALDLAKGGVVLIQGVEQ